MVEHTKLLGVIGWPIAHSLSPRLHNIWIEQYKLNAVYLPLPVKPGDFTDALRALPKLGFIGVNVTIPHKEMAYGCVDRRDAIAERIGAINTIIINADGTMLGTNTDAYGFAENLRLSGHDVTAGAALVLGAGGAARAVLAALLAEKCPRIILTNRTQGRALQLAKMMNPAIEVIPWEHRETVLRDIKLLANTTSLGMVGQEPLQLDLAELPPEATVCDLVYKPLQTPLLLAAAARNLRCVDGLGMLLYQAQAAFQHWFGMRPEITRALREMILAAM
jgi:shikimate dehydrogenase